MIFTFIHLADTRIHNETAFNIQEYKSNDNKV